MKTVRIIVFYLATVSFAFAEEPPELLARRDEHVSAVKRAQVPILANYLRSLEALRQQFQREGKSSAASDVDGEIIKIRQELELASAPAENPLRALLTATTWEIIGDNGVKIGRETFGADGQLSGEWKSPSTWIVTGAREGKVRTPNGTQKFTVNKEGTEITFETWKSKLRKLR